MREITIKYHSDKKKHRYELVEEPKKQSDSIFIDKKLPNKVIMDRRTTPAYTFRIRLGFKQDGIILAKEQSLLTKIMNSFDGINVQTQYNVFKL